MKTQKNPVEGANLQTGGTSAAVNFKSFVSLIAAFLFSLYLWALWPAIWLLATVYLVRGVQ